jgi:Icc-related predicted phosphoesterase
MRFLCTSDLHGFWDFAGWPEADCLIVAGDFTRYGRLHEVDEFNARLASVKCQHKVVIAGNHDWACQEEPEKVRRIFTNAHYLCDEAMELDGLRIAGYPWTPQFYDWAYMKPRQDMHIVWDQIPFGIDLLVTHGPPAGKLDWTSRGEYAGCEALRDAVERVRPQACVFGHVHSGYGQATNGVTDFYNVSRCNEAYHPVNDPVVFDLLPRPPT